MYSKSQTKPFYIGTKEAPSDCDVPNKGLLSVHEQCTFDKKNVDMFIYLQTHLFNFLINLSSHMRNRTTCIYSFHHMTFKIGFYRLRSGHIFNENLHCCYGRRQ